MRSSGGRRRRAGVLLATVILLGSPAARAEEPPLALVGAMQPEVQPLAEALATAVSCTLPPAPCLAGTLDGRRAIVVTIGVGKVNAAMVTALLLERFTPALVVFSGVAGGIDPELSPGDVVIGERLLQHDLVVHGEAGVLLRDVRDPSGVVRPNAIPASPQLIELARGLLPRLAPQLEPLPGLERAARVKLGTIVTGDAFVSAQAKKAELRERFLADAVEMEGAAVAHVCAQRGVPVLVVRGISDRAAGEATAEARRNLTVASGNAARVALAVARGLAATVKPQ